MRQFRPGVAQAFLLGSVLLCGCGPSQSPETSKSKPFEGTTLTFSLEKGSPLAEAIRNQLNEWEARTGAKVEMIEADLPDRKADLLVFSGSIAPQLADLPPLPKSVIDAPALHYLDLPALYRLRFLCRDDKMFALPLAADNVVLWYRRDLFTDPANLAEFQKQTGKSLAPPETWDDYLAVAKFFTRHPKVKYGCVEAMDASPDGLRNFYVHCAAYARGERWTSFVLNTETGLPRFQEPPFQRGLAEWKAARDASPAADGVVVNEATARRIFRAGDAAMLLTRSPPTIDLEKREKSPVAEHLFPARLPGSRVVYAPGAKQPTEMPAVNHASHLATTGWAIAIGATSKQPAAESLLLFLTVTEENYYLVQAARRGFVPIQANLLTEPARFSGYGLASSAVSPYFAILLQELDSPAWCTDLRLAPMAELEKRLAEQLQEVLQGKVPPEEALKKAQAEWTERIAGSKGKILAELRASLGLPAQ